MTGDITQTATGNPALPEQQQQQAPAPRAQAPQQQQQQRQSGAIPGVNYDQLSLLQKMIATLFMFLVGKVDQNDPNNGGLNGLIASIMGMRGDEYTNWRRDIDNNGGEWKPRTDFSRTDFDRARDFAQRPPERLLDIISRGEHDRSDHASGNSYNTAFGNRTVNFTGMTIDQVLSWQRNDPGDSAAGRYQIIEKTLRGLKRDMGLSGNEKFDAAMQDRMAGHLMEQRGLSKFLNGQMSEAAFMREMSKEWASLPKDNGGLSYYHGDGKNHARISPESMISALRLARENGNDLTRSTRSAASEYDVRTGPQQQGGIIASVSAMLGFSGPASGQTQTASAETQRPAPSTPAPMVDSLKL